MNECVDIAAHWDERYREKPNLWSGNVNATLVYAIELWKQARAIDGRASSRAEPGSAHGRRATHDSGVFGAELPGGKRSLDLGCGEGADVLWLARQGWNADGVDISAVAVSRARERAAHEDLSGARFFAEDLEQWEPEGKYELITASFFQSRIRLDRARILQRVGTHLAPGGALVLLSHAAPPPWADTSVDAPHAPIPTVESEHVIIGAIPDVNVVHASVVARDVVGPDGKPAQLKDLLVVAMRPAC